MAAVPMEMLGKAEKDELCVSYAALLLHDEGLEINAEKLNKVIKASGNEVEPYWPPLFAKALKGQDVGALLANVGNAAGPAGPTPSGPFDDKVSIGAESEKKVDEPEDVDMAGLFGDEDDDY